MAVDFQSALTNKYNILGQQAAAATTQANAEAALKQAQTQQVADNAAAQRRLQLAQAGLTSTQASLMPGQVASENELRQSQSRLTGTQANLMPSTTASENLLRNTQAATLPITASATSTQANAWANYYNQMGAATNRGLLDPSKAGLTGYFAPGFATTMDNMGPTLNTFAAPEGGLFDKSGKRVYAHGTERVPGKGSGKVDTVPAMLAPGEAVLNKAAAEHLGRGFIAALNEYGAAKMGMVDTDTEDDRAAVTKKEGKEPSKDTKDDRAVIHARKGKTKVAAKGKGKAPEKGGAGLSPGMIGMLMNAMSGHSLMAPPAGAPGGMAPNEASGSPMPAQGSPMGGGMNTPQGMRMGKTMVQNYAMGTEEVMPAPAPLEKKKR